jgi:alpha-tubulin suppressor-like RCC1 family protein
LVTCAVIAKSNALDCWGRNFNGQLGLGTTTDRYPPTQVPNMFALQVSNANAHTCAVVTTGGAYCWGADDFGELGDGSTSQSSNPVQVQGLPATPVQIAAGGAFDASFNNNDFSCGLLATGNVYCWGYGASGQLGDGVAANSLTPVQVALAGPAKQIVAGAQNACALLMTGLVQCWGADNFGQLGDGVGSGSQVSPVPVGGLSQVIQISQAGRSYSVCALTTTGVTYCWGDNTNDELGDGTAGGQANSPQPVQGL